MDTNTLADLLFPDVAMTEAELEAKYPPRNLPEGAVVSRMAPSPTGFVHLGNLVQGLTSERMSHQSGGVLFLRVEDTDAKREVPGAVEVLINTLKHYGIHFDEGATMDGDSGDYGPYRQRQRADIYHVYAKRLVREGKAYPCFCTEEELDRHAGAAGGQQGDHRLLRKICHLAGPASGGRAGGPGGRKALGPAVPFHRRRGAAVQI